jgi:uncharacterized membrane protein required for colicin V production
VSDPNLPPEEPTSADTPPEPGPAEPEAAATPEPPAAAEPEPASPEPEPVAAAQTEPAAPQPEPVAAAEPEPAAPEPEPVAAAEPPPPPPTDQQAPPPPPPPTGAYPPPPPPGAYPPPPPGGYPPPAAARSALSVGDAISYGWKGFTNNLGAVLLIVLAVVVIGGGVNVLASLVENAFLQFVLSLVAFVLGFIIALGLIRAALTITDGQRPSVGEVFKGEGVLQYAIAAIVLGLAFSLINIFGLVTILLLPVTFVVTMVLSFFVQFFGYAILDEGKSAFDGIARSFEVVRSNFGDLILLWLAAVGINIVGAALCLVGLLVTIPVTAIAWAFAWRRITNGLVAPLPQ